MSGPQEAGFRFLTKFGSYLNLYRANVGSTSFKPLELANVDNETIVQIKVCPGDGIE